MDEKRFNELYNRAYEKSYVTFSEFLNLQEQSVLANTYLPCVKFGGYENAERVVAGFGENVTVGDFPIALLEISPVMQKFADRLSHRDFLGALMNLGIKRELLGDIIVKDNIGYLFCLDHIKDYIIGSVDRIKHTTVTVREIEALPDDAVSVPKEYEKIVSSLRIDAVISAVYNLSRNDSAKLFAQEKVFVNSRQVSSPSYQLKNGDIISLRGFGRFIFDKALRSTKKDRLVISIQKYE